MVITAQHVENVLRIYRRELQQARLDNGGISKSRSPRAVRATLQARSKPSLLMDRIKYQVLELIHHDACGELDFASES